MLRNRTRFCGDCCWPCVCSYRWMGRVHEVTDFLAISLFVIWRRKILHMTNKEMAMNCVMLRGMVIGFHLQQEPWSGPHTTHHDPHRARHPHWKKLTTIIRTSSRSRHYPIVLSHSSRQDQTPGNTHHSFASSAFILPPFTYFHGITSDIISKIISPHSQHLWHRLSDHLS